MSKLWTAAIGLSVATLFFACASQKMIARAAGSGERKEQR